jgi:hypothetical protein
MTVNPRCETGVNICSVSSMDYVCIVSLKFIYVPASTRDQSASRRRYKTLPKPGVHEEPRGSCRILDLTWCKTCCDLHRFRRDTGMGTLSFMLGPPMDGWGVGSPWPHNRATHSALGSSPDTCRDSEASEPSSTRLLHRVVQDTHANREAFVSSRPSLKYFLTLFMQIRSIMAS